MKTSFRIIVALSVLALLSCKKDLNVNNAPKVITDFPTTEVECEVDAPVVDTEVPTKIFGYVADPVNAPGKHTVKWKAGDQISQFSVVSNKGSVADLNVGDVINFSNFRSTLKNGDGTKVFTMTIPDLMTLYGASSGVATWLCAFYPATTFSDIQVTPEENNGSMRYHVKAIPVSLIIPAVQDGTGWKYSIFYARSATFSAKYNSPVGGGGDDFQLLSVLLRLRLESTKNITKVVLTNTTAYMTGEVKEVTLNYFHGSAVYTNSTLSAGCDKPGNILTIETGEVLPNDLYFAIRELREGTTYTFTFTAEDGTTQSKSFSNPAGWANRKTRKVLSLGTLTLNDNDWH